MSTSEILRKIASIDFSTSEGLEQYYDLMWDLDEEEHAKYTAFLEWLLENA